MAANGGELFKTTLMGGYDKDDVAEGITRMKDAAYADKTRFLNTIKEKDKKIQQLNEKLNQSEQNIASLERDIKEKYQSYIDNYESIGRLVFDAQLRADNILKDANEKSARMLEQAQAAAQKCVESVQNEVDERLAEGKKKYIAVQEELNVTVELMNQVQRRFMEACKAVHNIVSTVPDSMQDLESEIEDDGFDDELFGISETSHMEGEDESYDEEDKIDNLEEQLQSQVHKYLEED